MRTRSSAGRRVCRGGLVMEVESAQRRLIHHAAESPYQSTLLLTMGSHNCDRPSGSDGPPAFPPASPEASPHKVKVYSMPPLAAQHSAMMRWRPAHGGCRADPEGARPTAAAPTQMMNIETIAALSRQPGWPWRLVPSRTAGGTRSQEGRDHSSGNRPPTTLMPAFDCTIMRFYLFLNSRSRFHSST